jgi:hypothetical protein
LPFRVVKFNIASGQIRNRNRRHDRFVSDVLQSLEFQVDLNLRFGSSGEKEKARDQQDAPNHIAT